MSSSLHNPIVLLTATGLAILAAAALPLQAQEADGQVHLVGNLSFVNTAGNSKLTTLSGDETLRKMTTDSLWKFQQTAAAVYGRSDDSTSASAFNAGVRADRILSSRLSAFIGGNWQRNRFAGIARRFEEIAGLGFQVLNLERDQLSVEAGASFNQQRSTLGVDDNFVAARAAGAYKHLLTDKAYIQQLAEFLPNLETSKDFRLDTETSLVAPISRALALKLSYTIHFDNLPEPGFAKTDRILSSGIQVTY
jgi:putative salt-induced outer membrane protein